jgi:hypothetical protein
MKNRASNFKKLSFILELFFLCACSDPWGTSKQVEPLKSELEALVVVTPELTESEMRQAELTYTDKQSTFASAVPSARQGGTKFIVPTSDHKIFKFFYSDRYVLNAYLWYYDVTDNTVKKLGEGWLKKQKEGALVQVPSEASYLIAVFYSGSENHVAVSIKALEPIESNLHLYEASSDLSVSFYIWDKNIDIDALVSKSMTIYLAEDISLKTGQHLKKGTLIREPRDINVLWEQEYHSILYRSSQIKHFIQDSDEKLNYTLVLEGLSSKKSFNLTVKKDKTPPALERFCRYMIGSYLGGETLRGDEIRLNFSEAMGIPTASEFIAFDKISDAVNAPAGVSDEMKKAAACNYRVTVLREGIKMELGRWCDLGGKALYDDTSHYNTGILLVGPPGERILQDDDILSVEVAPTIKDPAGNLINPEKRLACTDGHCEF